jgi:phosphoadenosine phosphosulfate reductase
MPPPPYQPLADLFHHQVQTYQARGLKLFASSSFQTHSIPMLHILSRIDPSIPVYFLQTGFHFPETMRFRDEVAALLGIQVIDVESPVMKWDQRDAQGNFYFTSNPDHCCYLNKTLPMEPLLHRYDVWISGVRRDQNAYRSGLSYEQPGKYDTLRYHPMLEWTNQLIFAYIKDHNLPRHPLEDAGYQSIGCEPCTMKLADMLENDRSGRWYGLNKTECGLHTDLVG